MRRVYETGVFAPVVAGVGGGFGVWAARDNVDAAPIVVFAALAAAALFVGLRERGVALAAVGVGAAAAFVSPAGLGPFLVATGVVIAAEPSSIDRRLARWPDLVHGVVAVPALAGLASVVAAQPSARGVALGAGTSALAVASWWRGPRHGVREAPRETVIGYLGVVGGLLVVLAPELFDVLGVLPEATVAAGRGLAAVLGVFAMTLVLGQLAAIRPKRPRPAPDGAARLRRRDSPISR